MLGRPSTYDPAFCDQVVGFMADGYSIAAFAGEIGVARSTVYKWMDEHADFSDAVKAGQAKAVLWWEKANRSVAMGGEGNPTACIFGLKNRAPDEWRDMKATEISGPDGGPVPFTRIEREIIDPQDTDTEGV